MNPPAPAPGNFQGRSEPSGGSPVSGAPQGRSFTPRRPEGPRKVKGGIKLIGTLREDRSAKDASESPSAAHQLARQVLALLESNCEAPQSAAGLEYAKAGQIVSIQFQPGAIEAQVQGSAPRRYATRINWPAFADEQWDQVIDALAHEAVHVAKLLAGELPPMIDQRFESLGLSIVPANAEAMTFSCTCPAAGSSGGANRGTRHDSFCKHAAAVGQVAAEQLAENPLLIFQLLGRSPEQVLDGLRQARMIHAAEPSTGPADSLLAELQAPALPLEACLDDFWRSPVRGREWEEIEGHASLHHVPHALLRRLGPSPMNGRFPLVGLLASVYDTVAAAAKKLRHDVAE